jgi:hypothetical protein
MATDLTRRLTRDELAQFLPSLKLIKAFETLISQVSEITPDELTRLNAEILSSQLGVFGSQPQRQRDVRVGEGLLSVRDAAGVTISVDLGNLIAAVIAFMPRPTPAPPPPRPDDANFIIAGRVFGR